MIKRNRLLRIYLFIFSLAFLMPEDSTGTNPISPGREIRQWKGYRRINFIVGGDSARLIVPDKPLKGNPWVWRARFPEWHTEMDSILLSEGFHIAYINTDGLYGNASAMDKWNSFYHYLIDEFSLSQKVSLEGVSRGGLFIYTWAKQNVDKVNCIYSEAPVCDITSWPGGFGKGFGSSDDWEELKKAYAFTSDDEAQNFNNNPIDNLEKLAESEVPIMHVIGMNDKIVPPQENTMVLVNRYIKLGGPVSIIPYSGDNQTLNGHHFPIEKPQLGADFIIYNTFIPKQQLDASDYHTVRDDLKNSFIKFSKDKKGTVAFLGGSITHNQGWRDSVCIWLENRFPDTDFNFINAGIPSMGSTPGAFRIERDVLSKGPIDLLFEEAAVNDVHNGRSAGDQVRGMEGIVRHVRKANPNTDMVIMHFADEDKNEAYLQGNEPQVIKSHESVAEHYYISTINLAKEVAFRIIEQEFTWEEDFQNVHPSPFGQQIYFNSIKRFLEDVWSGFIADDDKIMAHQQPEKLDENCYDKGWLMPAENSKPVTGWEIDEKWNPNDDKRTRPNYINVPMLIGQYPCKPVKIHFEGKAIGIAIASGPDAGILEYSIDGSGWEQQDLFTRYSTSYHLPWFYKLKDDLKEGKHVLRIKMSDEKNPVSKGNVCRIRYFFINK